MSLPQGAVKLHPDEREHKKDRDHCQHQHNAEGNDALLSSFASDVPRYARTRSMKLVMKRELIPAAFYGCVRFWS